QTLFQPAAEDIKDPKAPAVRPPLDVAFIGPPGSGKGTQARRFADKFGVCHVDMGSMLRSAAARNEQFKASINQGRLIADDPVCELVAQQLDGQSATRAFLLDGFPRTSGQAAKLDQMLSERRRSLSAVVQFDIPDDVATDRITGRLHHPGSGRVYHHSFQPPRVPGRDDATGESLTKRPDDFPDVMPRRGRWPLPRPHRPGAAAAGLLKRVDASKPADSVWSTLQSLFQVWLRAVHALHCLTTADWFVSTEASVVTISVSTEASVVPEAYRGVQAEASSWGKQQQSGNVNAMFLGPPGSGKGTSRSD
uniref:ADK_lid domain-containing protein n=1 Tax=Macrostomum lignano TaxID=282301 RepID=A0A1I8FH62_9PLAT